MQPTVVETLRVVGHEVYDFRNPFGGGRGFHWSEIDPNWQQWTPAHYRVALRHPIADQGFESDLAAMIWADVCVLVLPCGRSAHTEAGWMAGQGRTVYALITEPTEPELMYRLFNDVMTSIDELSIALRTPEAVR